MLVDRRGKISKGLLGLCHSCAFLVVFTSLFAKLLIVIFDSIYQHPAMIRGIKDLKAARDIDTTFFILSNSNAIFISTILEVRLFFFFEAPLENFFSGFQDKKITDIFSEVVTNPAEWDSSGLLKLHRRVDPSGPQHQCPVGCSPNMCKGAC